MSDRERCRDCVHISEKSKTGYHTCEWPIPYWAHPPQVVDPDRLITCPTFSQKAQVLTLEEEEAKKVIEQYKVIHVTPAIDESCEHEWPEDEDGQTDIYGVCNKCGLSFQRYIHSSCP